jgi:trehalose 6-phosphate synthase/phosphatase
VPALRNGHIEIKPQGVSKGTAAEMFLGVDAEKHLRRGSGASGAGGGRKVDFILAIGDDRSDEETFIAIEECMANPNSAVMPAMAGMYSC